MNGVYLNPTDRMAKYRQAKPIEELERKAKKARRKRYFTQEDIDLAMAEGAILYQYFDIEIEL